MSTRLTQSKDVLLPYVEPIEHVKAFCAEIGPRGPTTEAEARASAYAASKLREMGALDVSVETFRSVPSLWWALEIATVLALVSTAVYYWSSGRLWGLSVLLCLATLYIISMEFSFSRLSLSNFLFKRVSQNVYGKIHSKRKPRKKIVVIGHVDTNRTPILFHPRVVRYLTLMIVIAIVLVILKVFTFIFGSAHPTTLGFSLLLDLPLLVGLAAMLHGDFISPFTEGANDNAPGAAVTLSLAELFVHDPLENSEYWALCTGCEEATLSGIRAFLDEHGVELRDAYFIDLECLGIGQLRYITHEGMLKKFHSNAGLVRSAEKAAKAVGDSSIRPMPLRLGYTETAVVVRNGFRGITVMAFPEGKDEVPHWHRTSDRITNLDPRNLDKAVHFLEALLRDLDSE